ncbi:VasL domain-containing protein [Citrobacter amalonaticus]|uniref:VasL domain-containing protein n=1 Tax=Citrobacter amalonaticus TaxID=35703 RepID=UPI00300C51F2
MSYGTSRHLRPGGDPRTLPDYTALCDELNKLTHPARPDVNWLYAEKLCLSLFEHNGVELQTAAWYTLARTHLAGLQGLNEGLAILEALLTHQWGSLWPQPVHARMAILSGLSQRLQQKIRTLTLGYANLEPLYQAEKHLTATGDVLQRLELKHVSQLDGLRLQLHNAAVRLENSDGAVTETAAVALPSPTATLSDHNTAEKTQWVFVAQPEPLPGMTVISQSPLHLWKPFVAGMFAMLVLSGAALWGWQMLHRPDPRVEQVEASLRLPEPLHDLTPRTISLNAVQAREGIRLTEQQLARLGKLPPDWVLRYGSQLVQQAQSLWPEQATPLAQQWQQQLSTEALPAENLGGWHQGMAELQQLTDKLNALDERRGRYLTGSELKTMVYDITRAFSQSVPVEEQLRLLSQTPPGQPPAALQSQTEIALKQLTARYALIVQREPGR